MKKIISMLLVTIICLTLAGCGKSKSINTSLSDLGGVFAFDEVDIDFSDEITGKVINDDRKNLPEEKTVNVISNTGLDNKLLRWGISRSKGNQQPNPDPGAPELLKKYNSFYIGDTEKKRIYLTFDEGYENGYTSKILDVLKENKVQAVFFITGPYLKDHSDLVERMVNEGQIVGNHTIHHPSMPTIGDNQLEEEVLGLDRAFKDRFGKSMKYIRPPKGEYSERTLAICQKLGYRNMFWSFAYDDWYKDKIRGADYAYNIVMNNLHNGAILLLHAVSKDNADALDRIIKDVRAAGYEFGSVDEIK